MTYLKTLHLNQFRSYNTLHLNDITPRNVVLYGENGAGKTNILEALSLLSPGRGLRGAKIAEMQNQNSDKSEGWSVSAGIESHYGEVQIGTGRDIKTDKRLIRVNGQPVKNQATLGEWLSCLWLTPQMDRLFLDDKSQRRRFFDRLVYTFDPAHLGRLTRYENAMRQRMKLLKEGHNDPSWFTGIESQLAEVAVAISAARNEFCQKLQLAYHSATTEEQEHFPVATLGIDGDVERLLKSDSALKAEEKLKFIFERNRPRDAQSGITSSGPHRSDFMVSYTAKNMAAANCSTGEQKALLIGIILAHARLLKEEAGHAPLLLLDEIVAHLDQNRRKILSAILSTYPAQVWMTGTDSALFVDFYDHVQIYSVKESAVFPQGSS